MTEPKLIVPIHKEEMIAPAKAEGADILYVDYKNFVKNNRFSKPQLIRYIKVAHGLSIPIYLSFGAAIFEEDLPAITNIIDQLSTINIDGIMVNDFSVMEIIKHKKHKDLKFNIHLDSGLNLHNIAGCEMLKKWKAKSINITEEIYLKNVTRIKKYTNKTICININEAMWLLNYAVNWGIDLFKIDGTYEDLSRICLLISFLKEIISDIKLNRGFDNLKVEQVLNLMDHSKPRRHYRTDHFTRKIKDFSGNDFEFTGNIKIFNWDETKFIHPETTIDYSNIDKKSTRLRLRLTKIEHLSVIEKYINTTGSNFIDIIEYGDIISPSDLAKHSYTNIISKVKQFCKQYNMNLYLTTPKTLIERDIERVADTMKYLCYREPQPQGLVLNNFGLWRTVSNSRKLKDLNIELGYGLNIFNSKAVRLFESTCPVRGFNVPNYLEYNDIKGMLDNIKIPDRSFIVLGSSKLDTSGLCPLNNDLAIVSRLQCRAPCQKASYAIVDPFTNDMLPMVLDGFCRFHLAQSYIEDHLQNIDQLIDIGITDFTLDFSALPAEMIPPLLDRYCIALLSPEIYQPVQPEVIKYRPKIFLQETTI